MPEQVGSIEYDVIAETSGLLKAEKDVDKSTTTMVSSFSKADKGVKKLSTQVKKSSKAVQVGMDSMGRSAGQAGIQFQQLIGQVQGGQSFMLALSQQAADLGFVLGAPLLGAIAGIAASIAGILLPELFKATSGIVDLDQSVSKLTKNFR